MRKKKTYSFRKVMDALLNNPDVISWGDLYDKLGVFEWFKERYAEADVKYIFSTQKLNQYISQILADRYYTSKRCFYVEKYAYHQSAMDSLCYSPTGALLDCDEIILDLTEKTGSKKPTDYIRHMPDFKRS